jgi:hypothetical protein
LSQLDITRYKVDNFNSYNKGCCDTEVLLNEKEEINLASSSSKD